MNPIARKILATSVALPLLTLASRADVLAQWTFETSIPATAGPFTAEVGLYKDTAAALGFHAGTSTYSSPAGNGSTHSFSSNTWAIGDYYQFTVNTTGYGDLQVSWDQASSSTGPTGFNFAYSTDGINFTPFKDYTIDTTLSFSTTTMKPEVNKTADLTGIAEIGNISKVYFRLFDTTAPSSSNGTDRVDNFTINGSVFVPSVDRYWDGNGAAAGFGGSGTWTGSSVTWNDAADGTGNVAALAAQQKAVFKGTAGTITIGAAGADANSGMRFETSGYVLSGAGTLNLSATANRLEVTNAADSATISAVLSGSTGLEKIGAGTLILNANNTFTGTVKVTAGTLQIPNDSALGDPAGTLALAGGTLKLTASTTLNSNRTLSGNGTLDIPAGGTLTVSGTATTGLLVLANAGALMLTGGTQSIGGLTFMQAATVTSNSLPLTFTGNITTTNPTGTAVLDATVDFGSGTKTLNVNNGTAAVDLQITGAVRTAASGASVVKIGDGTLDLAVGNPNLLLTQIGITGPTPTNGGTLIVHSATGLGINPVRLNLGTLRNGSGGALSFNNGVSLGGQGTSGIVLEGSDFEFFGSGGFTVFQNPAVSQYAQKLTANANVYLTSGLNDVVPAPTGASISAGLIIAGTGRVTLNSLANTFSLPITVDGGKLDVIGSLTGTAQGKITVQNGGVLSGKQDFNSSIGALAVGVGGTVAPGTLGDPINATTAPDTTATLNTKDLTFDASGLYLLSLGGTATGLFDQLNVTGAVSLNGAVTVVIDPGYVPVKNDAFIIIANDGVDPVVGQFANAPNNVTFTSNSKFYSINYAAGDGNDVVLTVIPEPASASLFLLGTLGLATARRRRQA